MVAGCKVYFCSSSDISLPGSLRSKSLTRLKDIIFYCGTLTVYLIGPISQEITSP